MKAWLLATGLLVASASRADNAAVDSAIRSFNATAAAVFSDVKQHRGRVIDGDIAKLCITDYDKAIKAGASPTDKVPEHDETNLDGTTFRWAGTIEEIRQRYCDSALQQAGAQQDARLAPLKKVMKNDKLKMAAQTGTFILAGGSATSDPKRLAAATVWFEDTTPLGKTCNGGLEIHIVHRHQFDGQHKLVKTVDRQYCGDVPPSAYK